MAKVVEDYLQGSARKAERALGWKRQSVQLGLNERRTGIVCVDNYGARGRHKSEVILPKLEADIRSLVDVQAQADPKFQSTFLYARISARARAIASVSSQFASRCRGLRQNLSEVVIIPPCLEPLGMSAPFCGPLLSQ